MIRRAAILAGVPVGLALLLVVPLAAFLGPIHWLCAVIALALTVPPGVLTLVVAERMGKSSPYGRVTALFVGTFVRLVVGFGGAVLVFFAAGDTFRSQPFVYFGWVLGAYLVTLAVEMALLSGNKAGA